MNLSKNLQTQNLNVKHLAASAVLSFFSLLSVSAQADMALPEINFVDRNGVNVMSGKTSFNVSDVGIGAGALGLSHAVADFSGGLNPNYFGSRFNGGLWLTIGGADTYFNQSKQSFSNDGNDNFTPKTNNGTVLVKNNSTTFTLYQKDGTKVVYKSPYTNSGFKITSTTSPTGLIKTIHYKTASFGGTTQYRIQSVTQNNGFQLKFNYGANFASTSLSEDPNWTYPSNITAINNAIEYCSPTASTCSLSKEWPKSTYQWSNNYSTLKVIEPSGHTTAITKYASGGNAGKIEKIVRDSSPTRTYIYEDKVAISKFGNEEWHYIYQQAGPANFESHVSGPDGMLSVLTRTQAWYSPIERVNYGENTSYYHLNQTNKVDYTDNKESGDFRDAFSYDNRGNTTQIKTTASGLSDVIRSSHYDVTCNDRAKCNQPNYTIDAKGYRTDYSYYPNTGLVKSVTSPADKHGVRSQTRYFYSQRYAWYKNSSGSYVKASSPIWLLTKQSHCIKGAASGNGCALSSDEVVTTFEYGADAGPNNLFLKGTVVAVNGQTRRICNIYDDYGHQIAVIKPKANLTSCQ